MAKQSKPKDAEDVTLLAAAEVTMPENSVTLSDAARAGLTLAPAPKEPPTEQPSKALRMATAATAIDHNGEVLKFGDPVMVTQVQFAQLAAGGAVAENDWDDLAEA